jgi:methylase of polypeptide subunit release factors
VLELLGPTAYAALGRGEVIPALRATADGSPTATLTRLFVLQTPVAAAAAATALGDLDPLVRWGLLEPDAEPHTEPGGGPTVRAAVDVRPYAADDADLYLVSDLGTGIGGVNGPVAADHVLGVGGASTTLAQITVRPSVGAALDLGTGCGVQALHLTAHADRVVATDSNPRAVRFAGLSAALSGRTVDLRTGDLFAPVAGERFDLVVTNPPFVMAPEPTYTYRDSPYDGDELGHVLIAQAVDHLAEGGWFQALLGWLHVRGQDWRERVAGWVVPTGCDAWVIQREVLDPAEYAELWLRDSGDAGTPQYPQLYDRWLDALAARDVEGVGFGWVTLRATGTASPDVRIEDLRHPVEQPLGRAVQQRFEAVDRLRRLDADTLLASAVRPAAGLQLDRLALLGGPPDDAAVEVRLRQTRGVLRSAPLDAVGAAVVSGLDGRTAVAEVLDRIVAEHPGVDPHDLRRGAAEAVRTLVEEGYLELPA